MPSLPRGQVIDESVVGAYHVYGRVMQREFLLGRDPKTGRSHRHRKKLLRKRLEALASVFAVDCLDRAILDNHFHQILRNRPDVVARWSDREVAERWLRLKRTELELLPPPSEKRIAALLADTVRLAKIRRQLSSISTYMAYLRQPLALAYNIESGTTGSSFWAGRFGCMPLTTETSLLCCSLYVNLNLVHAGIAEGLEDSEETSVYDRILDRRNGDPKRPHSGWLAAVHVDGDGYDGQGRRASDLGYLGVTFDEYLGLLDGVIQRERAERTGVVEPTLPSVLERLGIDSAAWESSLRVTSRQFMAEHAISARLAAEARKSRAQ